MRRHEAVDYFSNFKNETGGVIFMGRKALFLSDKLSGVVNVEGEPITGSLFYNYLSDESPEEMAVDIKYISFLLRNLNKRYENYFYVEKEIFLSLFQDIKIREKKRSIIRLKCNDMEITLTLEDSGVVRKKNIFNANIYRSHRYINVSDFEIILSAYDFDKVICSGFENCARIGLKFNDDSDIIVFNNHKTLKRIWALAQILVSDTPSIRNKIK